VQFSSMSLFAGFPTFFLPWARRGSPPSHFFFFAKIIYPANFGDLHDLLER